MDYSFPKSGKLCGKMRIDAFYRQGKRFVSWPLRVTYLPSDGATEVLVWAPKSLFKRAYKRNRLRRLMREAYRLHQHELEGNWLLALNYMDKEELPYAVVEKAVCKAIKKMNSERAKE